MAWRGARLQAAAAVAVLVVACADDTDPAAPPVTTATPSSTTPPTSAVLPSEPPDGVVSATIEQTRPFVARGLVEVLFTNRTGDDFAIESLRVVDDRFAPIDPMARGMLVPAGHGPLRAPVPLGDARCDVAEPAPTVVEVVAADGSVATVAVDGAGAALLGRVHAERCRRQAITEAASITFGPPFESPDDATIRMTLRLERGTGTEAVTVTEMRGTVVFGLAILDDVGLPLTLGAGDDEVALDIELSAARCDAHGLIESNKTYRFPTWIQLGDAEPSMLELEPTGEARRLLEEAVRLNCT